MTTDGGGATDSFEIKLIKGDANTKQDNVKKEKDNVKQRKRERNRGGRTTRP